MANYTVNIGSQAYPVYGDVSKADEYLSASFHADSWNNTFTPEQKAQLLVTATRVLDRQRWKGDKADTAQELAFPRINMNLIPDPVLDATNGIPVDIENASFELALAIGDGSDVQNQQSTAERIQSMTAGSVSITNFRGVDEFPLRFPLIVQELLRPYLAGSGVTTIGAAKATGVDGETSFPADLGLSGGI